MAKIVVENIQKTYSGFPAVRNVDFSLEEGEFLTLLGPSGCGKTTTLRVIAGLEDADSGKIIIDGKTFLSREEGVYVPPEKRNLGLIFQSYALWPHMTVRRNIALGLEQKGMPKQEREGKVQEVLRKVKLEGYADRYPAELSGGQQQRVAVARMIAAEPLVFLMDEPLSNLDAMLRVDMRAELKHLHHELGATTIYVTHDQVEALTLSDKIAVMYEGIIRQLGTPKEVYEKSADLFVAQFVGSPRINLVEGRLRKEQGHVYFERGEIKKRIPGVPDTDKTDVIATVRPENITISREHLDGGFEAKVYSVLPAGSETIIKAESQNVDFTILVNGFSAIRMDEKVWLDFSGEYLNCYDPDTEKLIPIQS